jgi:hypothetical protein
MTEQTNTPAGHAGVSTPSQTDMNATLQITVERLLVGAQAARLAIDIAANTEQTTRAAQVAPRAISRNWQSANLLVEVAFDKFYGDVVELDFILRSIRRQA